MISAVIDTHAVIWYLASDSRLSQTALNFIQNAFQIGNQITVSSITLVETIYLVERGRISANQLSGLITEITDSMSGLIETPIDLKITQAVARINATLIPDMPDRIIAATGLHLNVPIITRDTKIHASGLQVIW